MARLFIVLLAFFSADLWAARTFNGSTQYATVSSSINYNSTDVTFSIWLYIPSSTGMTSNFVRLIEIGGFAGTTLDGFTIQVESTNGNIVAYVWNGGSGSTNIGTTSYAYSEDEWIHLAVTARLTTSELNRFYINGSQQGTDTTSGGRTANTQEFALAANNDGESGNFYDGYIAELAFFDTDLSAANVLALANGDSPLAVDPTNLVAYWRMDGSGSTEADLVSGATLTYTGSPGTTTGPAVDDPPGGGPAIPIFQHHQLQRMQ